MKRGLHAPSPTHPSTKPLRPSPSPGTTNYFIKNPNDSMHPCASATRSTRLLPPHPKPHRAHPIIVILAISFILFHVYAFNLGEYDLVYDTNSVLLCKKGYEFYVNCESNNVNCKNFVDLYSRHTVCRTTDTTPKTNPPSHPTQCSSRKLREFYVVYDLFDIFDNSLLDNTLRFGM